MHKFITTTLFFLSFEMVAAAASHRLIGGTPAPKEEWPASVSVEIGDDGYCTGTLVSARALLVAAHCVRDLPIVSFTAGGVWNFGWCTASPDFAADASADWALCYALFPVQNIPFERIATDDSLVAFQSRVDLQGYGCAEANGPALGELNAGSAEVRILPGVVADNYLLTWGGSAVCSGDSGGGAFAYSPDRGRRLVGVNSRGDEAQTSWIAALYTPAGKKFLRWWSQWYREPLCGVHENARNCRLDE